MSVTKSVRAKLTRKRIGGSKAEKPRKTAAPVGMPRGTRVVLVVLACVVGFAMLMAARDTNAPQPATGEVANVSAPAATPVKSATPARKPEADTTRPDPAAAGTTDRLSGAMTIEGCLVQAAGGFQLKDTSGDAPKARSWKSGFLKKGSTRVALTARPGISLAAHVNERVSVTGMLIDRDMYAHSLRRLAATCK